MRSAKSCASEATLARAVQREERKERRRTERRARSRAHGAHRCAVECQWTRKRSNNEGGAHGTAVLRPGREHTEAGTEAGSACLHGAAGRPSMARSWSPRTSCLHTMCCFGSASPGGWSVWPSPAARLPRELGAWRASNNLSPSESAAQHRRCGHCVSDRVCGGARRTLHALAERTEDVAPNGDASRPGDCIGGGGA